LDKQEAGHHYCLLVVLLQDLGASPKAFLQCCKENWLWEQIFEYHLSTQVSHPVVDNPMYKSAASTGVVEESDQ